MAFPLDEEKTEARRFWKRKEVFPASEFETIKLFEILGKRIGWEIVFLSPNSFPDAIIERKGKRLRVEFEYLAKNFFKHGHDPEGCDLVICWFNDWPDAPLPVWALIDCGGDEAYHINDVLRKHYMSRRTLTRMRRKIQNFLREVREALNLDADDPEWGEPDLKTQFEWTLDILYNPPKGFVWGLALAAASQNDLDAYTLAWWIRNTIEIREI